MPGGSGNIIYYCFLKKHDSGVGWLEIREKNSPNREKISTNDGGGAIWEPKNKIQLQSWSPLKVIYNFFKVFYHGIE